MEKREYPFEFSVVMAVYNVEPFLREAVDSLIAQDFGFHHIQLIMVDDGSTDGSGAICDEYGQRYPENVVVIHKENGGVSSARNEGLKQVEGRFVTFTDPDDKLSQNVMSTVHSFFCKNEEKVDIVTIPMYFFDAQTGPHNLNSRFQQGTRIIDLVVSFKTVHMSMATSFITNDAAKSFRFDERLAIAEDAKAVAIIMLRKQRLGVVSECIYYYRKRSQGTASAIQQATRSKKFYIDSVKYYTLDILSYCANSMGYVPNFIQYSIFNDLQWKFRMEHLPHDILSDSEIEEYYSLLSKSLQYIDDAVIMSFSDLSKEYKHFILAIKYHNNLSERMVGNDILYYHRNTNVSFLSDLLSFIDFCQFRDGCFEIEGYLTSPGSAENHEMSALLCVNGQFIQSEAVKRNASKSAIDRLFIRATSFRFRLPLKEEEYKIELYCNVDGHNVKKTNLMFGKFSALGKEYPHAHITAGKYVARHENSCISIAKRPLFTRMRLRWNFMGDLRKSNKASDCKAFFARLLYGIAKPFVRKEIWLVSDRPEVAGDNGEAFFRYLIARKLRGILPVFVIKREAKEYSELKKAGYVVPYCSWRHKFLYLLSSKIISSQADDLAFNPFFIFFRPYRDIIAKKRYIFLQHGIIKDDLSKWLSKYRQNLSYFVTSANAERESILKLPYYYSEKEVILTGLPRYDLLRNEQQKIVTIMPTWRANLVLSGDGTTGQRKASPAFAKSTYFRMYVGLLNSQRLLDAAERLGYQIQYISHPNMVIADEQISKDSQIKVITEEVTYRDIFAQSSLVVTDFSSVAFDFAYLRKPVIYFQADGDEFFSGAHTYCKGYFDYETDGFGEIEYDTDALVDRIIEYMESGCKLKDKYRQRIDEFFAFHDQKNCERVFEKIMELEGR